MARDPPRRARPSPRFSAPPPPPSEAGCSFVQPPPAVPATKTKKTPYTCVVFPDFGPSHKPRPFTTDEIKFLDSLVDYDLMFNGKRKFDPSIPDIPGRPGLVDLEEDPTEYSRLTKCATLAIDDYNSQMKTNYRFVDIDMATWECFSSLRYNITFRAWNGEKEETFQATVSTTKLMTCVEIVRMKGSSTWYDGVLSELN